MRQLLYPLILFCPLLIAFAAGYGSATDTAELNRQLEEIAATSDDDSAMGKYRDLYERSASGNYPSGQVRSLNAMSIRYFNKGMNDSMIGCLKQAIAEASGIPSLKRQLPSLYNNLGIAWQSTGSYDSSLSCYYKAIRLQDRYGTAISPATPYLNLGMLLRRLSRYDQAVKAVREAMTRYRKENDTSNMPTVYLNLGGLYSAMKMRDSFILAKRYLELALKEGCRRGQQQVEQKALYELGLLADYSNRSHEAIHYYEAAMSIPTGNPYDDLVPAINLGGNYILQGRYREALQLLEEGLGRAKELVPAPDFICDFYLQLASVNEHLGRDNIAINYYKHYINLSDSLRGQGLQARIDGLQQEYEASKQESELMRRQLLIADQQALIRRGKVVVYGVTAAVIALGIFLALWYKARQSANRRRWEQQKWEAARDAEEKERGRIARDLHDHVAGSLVTARQWFSTLLPDRAVAGQREEYRGALQLLDDTIAEVRTTAHYLVPGLVITHGLAHAVEAYCFSIQRASSIRVDYQYLGDLGRMQKEVELTLFRCVQELLQNVVKHSEASRALVQLSCHANGMLSMTVEDNGIGIAASSTEGMGLESIRRSISSLGGTFTIQPGRHIATTALAELDITPYLIRS